jgi:hypothetical protein
VEQWPEPQVSPALHGWLQPPQFWLSLVTSMHRPLQTICGALHTLPLELLEEDEALPVELLPVLAVVAEVLLPVLAPALLLPPVTVAEVDELEVVAAVVAADDELVVAALELELEVLPLLKQPARRTSTAA